VSIPCRSLLQSMDIIPCVCRSYRWSLSFRFPLQLHMCISAHPISDTCPIYLILLGLFTSVICSELCMLQNLHYAVFFILLLPPPPQTQISSSAPCSWTLSAYVHPSVQIIKFHTHTKQEAKFSVWFQMRAYSMRTKGSVLMT